MRDRVNPLDLRGDWHAALDQVLREPTRLQAMFQPIVDLRRGSVCGYEGLARFQVQGMPPEPEHWFTAASLFDLTASLEATVLEAFLAARANLPESCFLSVNISPRAVVSREVGNTFERHGDLGRMVLEITEQSVVDDYDRLLAVLARWRSAGAMIAVDDVGAGYASLRHVLAVRPQFMKLDGSLVSGAHEDPDKTVVLGALRAFADELGALLIAEGVERPEELDCLVGARVPLAQGYLIGAPTDRMDGLDPALYERIRAAAQPI